VVAQCRRVAEVAVHVNPSDHPISSGSEA
jgi:hypothetical protein